MENDCVWPHSGNDADEGDVDVSSFGDLVGCFLGANTTTVVCKPGAVAASGSGEGGGVAADGAAVDG